MFGSGEDGDLPQPKDLSNMSSHELRSLLELMEQYQIAHETSGVAKWFLPGTPFSIENCPKHESFFTAGSSFPERVFMAGNRTGKSVAGAIESACHATGIYPPWWKGRRFTHATKGWAIGESAQVARDTVQKELLGPPGALGTGTIPKDMIISMKPMHGVANGVESVEVRHISGGTSLITFKSYKQEMKKFMGTAMDWVWLDEECPELIYNECLVRTMTTDGIMYVTFTPLNGITPFITNYMKNATLLAGARPITSAKTAGFEDTDFFFDTKHEADERAKDIERSGRAVIQAGWADAPWLGDKVIDRMRRNTPEHLVDARMHGYPSIGAGNVYPVPLEDITCKPFEIPDHWKKMYALDVGWNRTAALHAAIDPTDNTIYIYSEYYVGEARPEMHYASLKTRGESIRGVIDPASRGRSQADGKNLIDTYKKLGLRIKAAKNALESGVYKTWGALSNGRIKIFSTLQNFQKEYMVYRRDINGRIPEGQDDHLMDCMRYIVNNIEVASQASPRMKSRGGTNSGSGRHYDI